MGATETPHFYDFGISGRVPGSQNQLFVFLATPGYLHKLRKHALTFLTILFLYISEGWKSNILVCFEKMRAEQWWIFV